MADDKYDPPETGTGDVVHTAVRIGLGLVPYAGGPAGELFSQILKEPLEKRRDAWMEDVANALREHEGRIGKLEDLGANDQFVTAVMHASQIATRSHQVEKLEALRNALLNIATGIGPDEDRQLIFLHFIDVLTPWHLRILEFCRDPGASANRAKVAVPTMGGIENILVGVFPKLAQEKEFYMKIWRDLHTNGLINIDSPAGMMTGGGLLASRTSDLGNRFLEFIMYRGPD